MPHKSFNLQPPSPLFTSLFNITLFLFKCPLQFSHPPPPLISFLHKPSGCFHFIRKFAGDPSDTPIQLTTSTIHSSIIFSSSAMAAADGFFRGVVYEGCISGHDHDVQRRPYHRNCGCAIHDKTPSSSSPKAACSHRGKSKNVSYPLRRAWSESCLALAASPAHSSPSSPAASAAANTLMGNCRPHHHHHQQQMGLTDLEEED